MIGKWTKILIWILVFTFAFSAFSFAASFKRSETLFVGGGLWSAPSNWNPLVPWAAVTGTVGLIYETLFFYDPLKNEYVPWLAEEGKWKDDTHYYLKLRDGIAWTDGEKFSADDVIYTFEIAKENPAITYSVLWKSLKEIKKLSENEVEFVFSTPKYHEWNFQLYQIPIIPKHIWSKVKKEDLVTTPNKNPVGTGMYKAEGYTDDRMIYVRNDNWWGISKFGKPAPKRIVVLKIYSNNVALGMIMKGELDLSNFFLPGIPAIKKAYGIKTWFDGPPYMLSDNTALLFLNTKKKPMDDARFRRAMAFAINVKPIVERVYERQVKASNPLGFLPVDSWMKYYDENVVKKYGFSYDPKKAKKLLDEAGYADKDKDGYRDMPDGGKIALTIIVPFGWTDWMESIKSIAADLRKVGLNVEAKFPDYGKYSEDMYSAGFDIILNNFGSNVSSTPWTYFNWVCNSQIENEKAYGGNWGRYKNKKLFDLIDKFNQTKPETPESKKIASQIEEIMLKEMPAIPLWYNGMWFQASTRYWKGYPDEKNPYAWPSTWGGRWQIGGLRIPLHIKPAK